MHHIVCLCLSAATVGHELSSAQSIASVGKLGRAAATDHALDKAVLAVPGVGAAVRIHKRVAVGIVGVAAGVSCGQAASQV